VVLAEDVHWADASSVAGLQALLPLMAQQPMLFLAALRPDTDSPGWQLVTSARQHFGQALTEVTLDQLTDADSRSLVANLLVIESLPDARPRPHPGPRRRQPILRRGGRAHAHRGRRDRASRGHWTAAAHIADVEIPATLHGLLLARIDQLPEEAKRSLRIASVIGRQFPVRVLERVLAQTTEVTA
jgi:predicted ATPase